MRLKFYWMTIMLFMCCFLIAQERAYEDINGNRINEENFRKERGVNDIIYAYKYSNDTLITFLYAGNRKLKGKLSEEDVKEFRKRFHFGINNKPVIITYFHALDDCNRHISYSPDEFIKMEKESYKSLSKYTLVYKFYWKDEGVKNLIKTLKWFKDEDEWISSKFFQYHFPCGSYVVVDFEGNYRGYLGEYMNSQIVEDYNKLK